VRGKVTAISLEAMAKRYEVKESARSEGRFSFLLFKKM
jgi:hypothetical protein